jgi:hypothetical protein
MKSASLIEGAAPGSATISIEAGRSAPSIINTFKTIFYFHDQHDYIISCKKRGKV